MIRERGSNELLTLACLSASNNAQIFPPFPQSSVSWRGVCDEKPLILLCWRKKTPETRRWTAVQLSMDRKTSETPCTGLQTSPRSYHIQPYNYGITPALDSHPLRSSEPDDTSTTTNRPKWRIVHFRFTGSMWSGAAAGRGDEVGGVEGG
ncbi:hypothetical protein CPC08DRAFT_226495 [Agrocybe pediades]|nr:hypothetical protein CPC08DRAFT_226495 [Agrocybe pediades]